MSRPDFLKKWASSRVSIPAISDPDYALGFAAYLGSQPPTTDDHDYIFNLQDKRAVWLGEQMLLAVGHEWQDDVTYDAFAITRSPVDGQLYRSLVGSNLGNEPSVSGSQWALGVQPLSTDFLNTTRINVASAATVNLTSAAPNTRNINITGTTTITAFTVAAGQTYFVRFAASLTLTNSAGIVTQSGVNIITQAGDTCIIRATAANVVEVLCYVPAGGWANSLTDNGYQRLPGGLIIQWGYSSSWAPVVFPVVFPNTVVSVTSTPRFPAQHEHGVTNVTTAGFSPATNGATSPFYYIALGY